MQGIQHWEYVRNLLFIESIKFGLMQCKFAKYARDLGAAGGTLEECFSCPCSAPASAFSLAYRASLMKTEWNRYLNGKLRILKAKPESRQQVFSIAAIVRVCPVTIVI